MSYVLLTSAPTATLLTERAIIPAADVASLDTAVELIEALEAHRAVVARAARAEGFEAGRAEGLERAAARTAEILAETHRILDAERERLRGQTAALALEVVRRIAANLGPDATVAALAERAVRDLLPEEPIRVRVAAERVGAVAARLWPIHERVEVSAEPGLDPDECLIDTPSGHVRAGLAVQLAALEKAFARTEAGAAA